jgi:flavin reductase
MAGADILDARAAFRNAMAAVPAPVHVITTDGPVGKGGITATAFTAITDEPPTVLVCLNRNSYAAGLVKTNGTLAVNTLPDGMHETAGRFAGVGKLAMPDRFMPEEDWQQSPHGAPILPNALAVFDCRVQEVQEMGTHFLFFCTVETSMSRAPSHEGMIYHQRGYKITSTPPAHPTNP